MTAGLRKFPTRAEAKNLLRISQSPLKGIVTDEQLDHYLLAVEGMLGGFAPERVPAATPAPLPPPAARRPTRAEAIGAGKKVWHGGPAIPEDIVDAVGVLFGGFAPEEPKPVEVEVPILGTGPDRHNLPYIRLTDRNGHYAGQDVYRAVAARSNAWEEIKDGLRELVDVTYGTRGCGLTEALLDKMNRPEMGVGPKSND